MILRKLLLVTTFWCIMCESHEGRPVFIDIVEREPGNYLLKWKIPPVLLPGQEPIIGLKGLGCIRPYAEKKIGLPNARLNGRVYYQCGEDLKDLSVILSYPEINPALTSLVIFKTTDGRIKQIFSGPEKLSIPLLSEVSGWEIVNQYIVAGIQHILEGYDHLAFVTCLIMIAGVGKRLIYTVTGFTIAHSITLSLATLDLLRLPSLVVETLIAISILLLATELHRNRYTGHLSFTWRYPILTAGLFGLLHGFGFASVLADLGLPDDLRLPALLFFNVGVEIGQLLFVGVTLLVVFILLRSSRWISANFILLEKAMIYFLGMIGAYWTIERLLFW